MRWSRTVVAIGTLVGAALVFPNRACAQDDWGYDDGRSERSDRSDDRDPGRGERDLSPQELRDFMFPDPYRPWGRPRYLDRQYERTRSYSRCRPRPRRYREYYDDAYIYRFGPRQLFDRQGDDLERAYRQGIADGQNYERFEIQAERGLAAYSGAMAEGHFEFEAGRYESASRHFLLAATVNQGDPTSRICAAHAHFALGDYEPAVRMLRRSFELQPKWLYLPIDIRGAYGNPHEFTKHLEALRKAADTDSGNASLWLLLGYCRYYSGDSRGALDAMTNAVKLQPKDEFAARLARQVGVSPSRLERAKRQRKSQRTGHDL